MLENSIIETGCASLCKKGEALCGDNLTLSRDEERTVAVLADGLGSGVKANILSTLTSTILHTLMARRLPLDECIDTVAAALPVCKERRLAYSTFTALDLTRDRLQLVQFDNPAALLLRGGKALDYRSTVRFVGDKEVHECSLPLMDGDLIVLMSDGVTHAGVGKLSPNGWPREEVAAYLERLDTAQMCAAHIAARVVCACQTLYENECDDDTTVFVAKARPHAPVSIMIGPPERRDDDDKVFRLFFSKSGKKIVCGGSTAQAVSQYLRRPLTVVEDSGTELVPDMGRIEGVDLVTEGVLTLRQALSCCREFAGDAMSFLRLCEQKDPASRLALLLLEEATDITIYLGRAVNEAHAGTEIDFPAKLRLVSELEDVLTALGKNVRVSNC